MSKEHPTDRSVDFKLERYKYILQQIHALNENTHKYLTLYQTLATAVVGGGIIIFVSWKELKLDATAAKVGIKGALGLLVILTLFVIFSIISGMFSWFDYRREEVELLNKEIRTDFRDPPRWKNLWRWPETYLVLFLLVVMIAILLYVKYQVIPLMQ